MAIYWPKKRRLSASLSLSVPRSAVAFRFHLIRHPSSFILPPLPALPSLPFGKRTGKATSATAAVSCAGRTAKSCLQKNSKREARRPINRCDGLRLRFLELAMHHYAKPA